MTPRHLTNAPPTRRPLTAYAYATDAAYAYAYACSLHHLHIARRQRRCPRPLHPTPPPQVRHAVAAHCCSLCCLLGGGRLGDQWGTWALDALHNFLRDPDPTVRGAAVDAVPFIFRLLVAFAHRYMYADPITRQKAITTAAAAADRAAKAKADERNGNGAAAEEDGGGGGGGGGGGEGAEEIDVDVLGGWSPSPTWSEVETGACRARWQCMRETVASVTQTVRVKAKATGSSDAKVPNRTA